MQHHVVVQSIATTGPKSTQGFLSRQIPANMAEPPKRILV